MGDIEQTAAVWAIQAAEGPLDPVRQQALDTWLARDSRHLGAFVRAQAMWLDLDRVAALDPGARVEAPMPARPPASRWPGFALAASLVLVVTAALGYDRLEGRIVTGHGEVREIALEDGSTMFVNGNSVIQVRFRDNERRIVLRRGEASFKVAHNTARPFVVAAGDVDVKAVGTEFVVALGGSDDVEVTVTEGVVAVEDEAQAVGQRLLRRNEQFVMAATGPRKAVLDGAEVERRTAWRRGLLVFRGQPLGAAAAEVNRYSETPVVIDDPTLARAEFIGVFKLGDSRAFAEAAARAFNGEVIAEPEGLRLVRQQNSPSH